MRRLAPRRLDSALAELSKQLAPATTLARVQACWPDAAGAAIAAEAEPVSERAGVVTLACRSAVWAQELDLMAPQLVERLNDALAAPVVRSLRCVATGGGIRR